VERRRWRRRGKGRFAGGWDEARSGRGRERLREREREKEWRGGRNENALIPRPSVIIFRKSLPAGVALLVKERGRQRGRGVEKGYSTSVPLYRDYAYGVSQDHQFTNTIFILYYKNYTIRKYKI
jgi:hypothetical protein